MKLLPNTFNYITSLRINVSNCHCFTDSLSGLSCRDPQVWVITQHLPRALTRNGTENKVAKTPSSTLIGTAGVPRSDPSLLGHSAYLTNTIVSLYKPILGYMWGKKIKNKFFCHSPPVSCQHGCTTSRGS